MPTKSGDPNSPANGDTKVEFVYDYLGRRVEKKVSTHNGTSWSVTDRRRFVYSFGRPGWDGVRRTLEIRSGRCWCWSHRFGGLPYVLELDASDPNDVTILRKYTWGLDLAGTAVSAVSDT